MTSKILVLSSDQNALDALRRSLCSDIFGCSIYPDLAKALDNFPKEPASALQAVFYDEGSRGQSREDMRRIKSIFGQVPIVFLAPGNMNGALAEIRDETYEVLMKPLQIEEVKKVFENICHLRVVESDPPNGGLIGTSLAVQKVKEFISRVAQTDASVLITGESGTDKELVARAIHKMSLRAAAPYVAVNCSAIPEDLLESELFGHGKGAFTGAITRHKGLFEQANCGTFFLDEIGDMPAHLQAKLLRVLEEKEIRPVGETRNIQVNARILSATHQNLIEMTKDGKFREDLYFRLNVLHIHLPPLRERIEDISMLAEHFLGRAALKNHKEVLGISPRAMARLIQHPWRGNVRELKNLIERSVVLATGAELQEEDISFDELSLDNFPEPALEDMYKHFPDDKPLKEIEKHYIQHILRKSDGVRDRAAKILDIDRKTLYRKEQAYRLGLSSSDPLK